MRSLCDVPSDEFVKSCLPLFDGPAVEITIGELSYHVPKALLCRHSPYFSAMFDGQFKESTSRSTILEEIEGIVSERSVSMFLQWLYTGHANLVVDTAVESIEAHIEFARLADMLGIDHLGSYAAEHIKDTILEHRPADYENADANCYHVTPYHLQQARCLPKGHAIRTTLAKACVENFLSGNEFDFNEEMQDHAELAADLVSQLRPVLRKMASHSRAYPYKDPLTEETRYL
ncbi:hypothetical protein BDV06DRAFT_87525 [Aspergillus oleicola]